MRHCARPESAEKFGVSRYSGLGRGSGWEERVERGEDMTMFLRWEAFVQSVPVLGVVLRHKKVKETDIIMHMSC